MKPAICRLGLDPTLARMFRAMRKAEQKAAKEEVDGWVGVGSSRCLHTPEAKHGDTDHGQEGSHGQRDSLCRPPDDHEQHKGQTVPGVFRHAETGLACDYGSKGCHPKDKAQPMFHLQQLEPACNLPDVYRHTFLLLLICTRGLSLPGGQTCPPGRHRSGGFTGRENVLAVRAPCPPQHPAWPVRQDAAAVVTVPGPENGPCGLWALRREIWSCPSCFPPVRASF